MYSSPCIECWVRQNVLNLAIRGPVDVILMWNATLLTKDCGCQDTDKQVQSTDEYTNWGPEMSQTFTSAPGPAFRPLLVDLQTIPKSRPGQQLVIQA